VSNRASSVDMVASLRTPDSRSDEHYRVPRLSEGKSISHRGQKVEVFKLPPF
jgi:hypothetical protein